MTHSLWLGVDVGGTFTDAVAYDVDGRRLRWSKVPSTPDDPAQGVLDALSSLTSEFEHVDRFVHGITIGTNAIIERKGAQVWVVTTLGFRDALEIARTERRELYNIKTLKPASLVPRTRILEVNERLRHDGRPSQSADRQRRGLLPAQLRQ
jgi:N-methylhydantoinase A